MTLLDIDRFRKVQNLATGGATEGERSAARSRMEAMAAAAGITVEAAIANTDQQSTAGNFFAGFSDWMEDREPGYKAQRARERAARDARDAIRRKEVLTKWGSEAALFARTAHEYLLRQSVQHLAVFSEHVDADGVTHVYASALDGVHHCWWLKELTPPTIAAVKTAYPFPTSVACVWAEYQSWELLRSERDLFCGGEWNNYLEVDARLALLRDAMDNTPASTWGDLDARFAWWADFLKHEVMADPKQESQRKARIEEDIRILRNVKRGARRPQRAVHQMDLFAGL